MKHRLPRALLIGIQHIDAFVAAVGNAVVCNFFDGIHYMMERFLIRIQDIRNMLFRDNQYMPVDILGNIQKAQRILILIAFHAGNFPCDNFTKNTVIHILFSFC